MAIIGRGVLVGMGITFKTFLETYPWGRGVLRLLRIPTANGLVTIEYPNVKQQHAERFRYFPFLIYDGTPDNLRCVSCKICEQDCPPKCIFIEGPAKDEQGRPQAIQINYGRGQVYLFAAHPEGSVFYRQLPQDFSGAKFFDQFLRRL